MKNVIGYVRVSTAGQAKEGYSLEYQQDEIRAYCKSQGWNLLHVFSDEGISGAKVDDDAFEVDRKGFQQMLGCLAREKVDYVVVLNTSRLWRSDIVKVLVHRELKKYSVDIRSIEQPTYSIYAHNPTDILVNGLMELLDAYQRLEISMKLGRGRKKKASEGGYAGGRAAYGYRSKRGSKMIIPNDDEVFAVRRIFELKELFPHWSLAQISKQLEYDRILDNDKPFSKMKIKRILDRAEFYHGIYKYGDIEATGQHQAII